MRLHVVKRLLNLEIDKIYNIIDSEYPDLVSLRTFSLS